jgi:uncharacterized protein (TIGR02217 family)
MSITVLGDVLIAHQEFAQNITGVVRRKNQRVSTANGYESINIVWDSSVREYTLDIGPLRRERREQVDAIFETTEAGAFGCLMLDPKDNAVTTAQGRVADLGGGTYQLYKRYTEPTSGRYKDRKLTRPKASTVVVYVSGVATDFELDDTNGTLTITGNPSASTVTWSGQFYVPVHFVNDELEWQMVVAGGDPDGRFYRSTVVLQEIRE